MPDQPEESQATPGQVTAAEPSSDHFEPPSFLDAIKGAFPRQRLTSRRLPRPSAQPATGTEEDARRVNYIDRRERTIGLFLAVFQLVLGVVVYVELRHYVKHPGKGVSVHQAHIQTLNSQHTAIWLLLINVVLGLAIAGGVWSKRRALVGFTIILGGLAMNASGGGFIGIVYLGIGLWLIFRAMKRNPSRRTAPAAAEGRKARGAAKKEPAPAPRKPPPPSKRYTPPRPNSRPAAKTTPGRDEEPSGMRARLGRKLRRE
jgi:hypothetical protein